MLFQTTVPDIMTSVLNQSAIDTNQKRKAAAAKMLDYYSGVQLDRLHNDLQKFMLDPGKLKLCCVNIVKKIVDRLSSVYMMPAKREIINGTEADSALFAEIALSSRLPVKLKMASRYCKLLKTVMLRIVWRNGSIALDIITPDLIDVETGDSPDDLRAVTVTHVGTRPEDTTYHRWTESVFQILDWRGGVISSEPNPYHVVPFIVLWDSLPTNEFFLPIPEDLSSLQEAINSALSDLLYTIKMQSHGQPVSKGLDADREVEVGPNHVISFEADTSDRKSDFYYAKTNAMIEETVNAIERIMHWACLSAGLPASSISTTATEESGISKLVDNFELTEARQDAIELFRTYEDDLFSLIRIVNNVHNARKISDSAELKVDFAEIKQTVSEKERVENWERLLELGLVSKIDLVMMRNPDLTRDDAKLLLLRIAEENKEFSNSIY